MSTFHPFGAVVYNLASSIGSTDTTITLSSFKEVPTGTPYTMALLNTSIVFATIAPKTTQSEFISFTAITQNADGTATLTGVTRGLAKKSPFTSNAAYKLPHSGQTQFIISDPPQLFEQYVSLTNDQTIAGLITFTQPPIGINPGGQPDASTTVKGVARISVAPVTPTIPIAVGDNDTRVPPVNTSALTAGELLALVGNNTDVAVGTGNKYMTQTGEIHNAEKYAVDNSGSTTAYTIALSPIPTSLTDGMVVYAKIVSANTTTTPTLNLNGLGAKTIVKQGGNALGAGDISANSLNTFIYDLTNTRWILQNPPSNSMTLISTTAVTAVVSITLSSIPSFNRLLVVLDAVTHSDNSDFLRIFISNDNGSTFGSAITISGLAPAASTGVFFGDVLIYFANQTSTDKVLSISTMCTVSNTNFGSGGGETTKTGIINALKIAPTGNFGSGGNIYLYGIN